VKRIASFFWSIHRAALDPLFFREVRTQPPGRAWRFFAGIVVLSSICMGIADTYYVLRPGSSFADQVAAALDGIAVVHGALVPPKQTPYIIGPKKFGKAIELIGGISSVVDYMPDSLLVVDTGNAIVPATLKNTQVILAKRNIIINPASVLSRAFPYDSIFGSGEFTVTPASVQVLIRRAVGVIFSLLLARDTVFQVFKCLVAFFFLFLAAFILKIEGIRPFLDSCSFALYASVPFVIGTTLEAVAGTRIKGALFFFLMLSLFVLFRGVRSCLIETRERNSNQ
jgi:hypothetical protein